MVEKIIKSEMLCRKIGSLALTRSWFLKWKIRKKTRKILINSKWDKKTDNLFYTRRLHSFTKYEMRVRNSKQVLEELENYQIFWDFIPLDFRNFVFQRERERRREKKLFFFPDWNPQNDFFVFFHFSFRLFSELNLFNLSHWLIYILFSVWPMGKGNNFENFRWQLWSNIEWRAQ